MNPSRAFQLLAVAALIAACQGGPADRPDAGGATGTSASAGGGGGPSFTVAATTTSTGGCSDAGLDASTGCEGVDGGASYTADIEPILAQSCNGELCHVTPTYDTLVGRTASECCDGRLLVAPGDADHSYLMDKLLGAPLCSGGRMPLGAPALADADVSTMRRWICAGAPHD